MITRDDVTNAQQRIAPFVRRTPNLVVSDGSLILKCEFLQHTGVFKARGSFNRVLAATEAGALDPKIGIVAASGGNAGLAHAYTAARLGIPATVFVPITAPDTKVARLREYGAQVVQIGDEYADAYEAAVSHSDRSGALFCHAYDQPEIAAGAGTIALEILEDHPRIDTIIVAVGGGGLFAGIAAGAGDQVRIVMAEPERAPTMHAALQIGRPIDVSVSGIAADSLGARRVGDIAFALTRQTSPISVLVSDDEISQARHRLWRDFRIPAEHGAATALAALDAGAYQPGDGEHVAVVVCGANTDPATLSPPV